MYFGIVSSFLYHQQIGVTSRMTEHELYERTLSEMALRHFAKLRQISFATLSCLPLRLT